MDSDDQLKFPIFVLMLNLFCYNFFSILEKGVCHSEKDIKEHREDFYVDVYREISERVRERDTERETEIQK